MPFRHKLHFRFLKKDPIETKKKTEVQSSLLGGLFEQWTNTNLNWGGDNVHYFVSDMQTLGDYLYASFINGSVAPGDVKNKQLLLLWYLFKTILVMKDNF